MWTSDSGVAPAYNVQITADASQGLIADVEVVNDPQDSEQLVAATGSTPATAWEISLRSPC